MYWAKATYRFKNQAHKISAVRKRQADVVAVYETAFPDSGCNFIDRRLARNSNFNTGLSIRATTACVMFCQSDNSPDGEGDPVQCHQALKRGPIQRQPRFNALRWSAPEGVRLVEGLP